MAQFAEPVGKISQVESALNALEIQIKRSEELTAKEEAAIQDVLRQEPPSGAKTTGNDVAANVKLAGRIGEMAEILCAVNMRRSSMLDRLEL